MMQKRTLIKYGLMGSLMPLFHSIDKDNAQHFMPDGGMPDEPDAADDASPDVGARMIEALQETYGVSRSNAEALQAARESELGLSGAFGAASALVTRRGILAWHPGARKTPAGIFGVGVASAFSIYASGKPYLDHMKERGYALCDASYVEKTFNMKRDKAELFAKHHQNMLESNIGNSAAMTAGGVALASFVYHINEYVQDDPPAPRA